MKKWIKYVISSICIVAISFGVYIYTNKNEIQIKRDELESKIYLKGFKDAKKLAVDKNKELYVAYEDEIVKISEDKKIEKRIKNTKLEIDDIEIIEDNIFVLSKEMLYRYDIDSGKESEILDDIPYIEEGLDRRLLRLDNKLLVCIGASTNSGVASKGGIFEREKKDIPSFDVELTGENFGKDKTSGFKEYGEGGKEGEIIKGELLSNASIISVDINTLKVECFSSGIRNIEGIDINSKGEVYAIVGGMEEEGERPVKRDSDYIYNIIKGEWYGWPDYSGGDPISSPRFTDDKPIKEIIKNKPKNVVKSPFYQHGDVDSLEELAIDKDGVIGEKDSIIFSDEEKGVVYSLGTDKKLLEIAKLNEGNEVDDIIFLKDECLLLDGEVGYIYSFEKSERLLDEKIPKIGMVIIIFGFIILLLLVVSKILRSKGI